MTLGLEVGGQEKLLVDLARHADRERVALHIMSLGERGPLAPEIEAQGWPVTALHAGDGLRPGLIIRLARLFRRRNIDVVHSHDDRPHIYAAPAARLAGVPRIIHTRHSQGLHLSRRQAWVTRLVAFCDHRFVCISRNSAEYAIRQGVPRNRVRVLYNGVDLSRYSYTGPATDGPAVVVARLAPEKDIATLLAATALVRRTHPDFRLEVAGDGPCREALVRQARDLGLDQTVHFRGVEHDVPGLLARARLFVLSSLTEGISLTLLEAMGRGLPVVATAVGGNPEVVQDGETGLLTPAGNPEALAAALGKLWSQPNLGRQFGQAGRQRVEAVFDIRQTAARYEAMYRGEE